MYVSLENEKANDEDRTCSDEKCSQVQVIICSCSAHLYSSAIHITTPGSSTPPSLQYLCSANNPLPGFQDLFNDFTLSYISSLPKKYCSKATLQKFDLDKEMLQLRLPSRAKKYIRNPFRILGLVNRTRVSVQGLLSARLLFNIAVVVIWVLVRRFAELFGVKLPPLTLVTDSTNGKAETRERAPRREGRPTEE